MATKTGEMREALMDCIERVRERKMSPEEATAIAKLAAQVSVSMKVEAEIRLEGLRGEKLPLGHMVIGDEAPALENKA